jgi:hypothetical protein
MVEVKTTWMSYFSLVPREWLGEGVVNELRCVNTSKCFSHSDDLWVFSSFPQHDQCPVLILILIPRPVRGGVYILLKPPTGHLYINFPLTLQPKQAKIFNTS